ncbi:hypothetical protein Ddc_14144 [Ditylenchus destructor]|nr:hypothetical protein Ddc_14144 [Ditylenchus destructor]
MVYITIHGELTGWLGGYLCSSSVALACYVRAVVWELTFSSATETRNVTSDTRKDIKRLRSKLTFEFQMHKAMTGFVKAKCTLECAK